MPAHWEGRTTSTEGSVCFVLNDNWWDVVLRLTPQGGKNWIVHGPGVTRNLGDVPRCQAMAVAEDIAFNRARATED